MIYLVFGITNELRKSKERFFARLISNNACLTLFLFKLYHFFYKVFLTPKESDESVNILWGFTFYEHNQ
ncbi:MAG TPA: hypothetical protein PKL30_21160 [Leptospiraceae bacterium]|nr:hypothetical protein [Leptospiraceae bacterium]HMX33199.1 hypothetical protein [Leptospiraceae bacterium]HMZ64103.1 hypothetical protein [Leptospiraceae bacterium]HNA09457.1 hypothetical protein [Leptospiraceae bacterium]HNE09934.1 hypothetical protein [Leptospiraceae bacterium]